MKLFEFDGKTYADAYRRQGWVHIPSGVTPEFLDYAVDAVRSSGALDPLQGPAIAGAKTQYVFDFPKELDLDRELYDVVAAMSGLCRDRLTLSERHIKAYLPDADPLPEPHKDRFASGIALGLSLAVSPDSHVVLYPDTDRGVNPHLTAGLRDALLPEQQPGVTLRGGFETTIHDAPGDVMAFPGADVWHLRRNAASTVLLYLKFNDFDCDPLGEDPKTEARRQRSLQLVREPDALRDARLAPARRFDSVGHETGRGRETWHVNVWEGDTRTAVPVPAPYAALANAVDGLATVAELSDRGVGDLAGEQLVEAARALVECGALDLLPGGEGS